MKIPPMKGLIEKSTLHRFDTWFDTMCGGDQGWQEADFGEQEPQPPKMDNVSIATDFHDKGELASCEDKGPQK